MEHSESLVNIAKALVAVEKEIKNPKATKDNPFYHSKYAPLEVILEENRPLLAKNGLVALQSLGGNGEGTTTTTMFLHTSGEFVISDPLPLKPDKDTPQGGGSAATYGRRYSLSGMLGIASEDDDDANTGESKPKTAQKKDAPSETTAGGADKEKLYKVQALLVNRGICTSTKGLTDGDLDKVREDNKLATFEYLEKHEIPIDNELNPLWHMKAETLSTLEGIIRKEIGEMTGESKDEA